MKKLVAILLSAFMLVSLCAVNTSALEDADNGNIKLLAKADKSDAFYESAGPQDMYGFDVKGYVDLGYGEQLIGSTFSNYGYHTFMNVDGANGKMDGMLYYGAVYAGDYAEEATADLYAQYQNGEIEYSVYIEAYDAARNEYQALIDAEGDYDLEAALRAMSYDTAGAPEQTIGGLKLKLENSYAGGGNYVKISYTVTNPTSSAKTFSLSTTSDVQVNGDDSATLKVLPGGLGAKLVSDDGCMFVVDGAGGDVDSLWIGHWGGSYFTNMFNDSPDDAIYDQGDSAICWSWTNRTIAAGESVSLYVLMEVGINQGPSIVIEDDLDDVGATLDGYILDPNLGTVNLYYTIDNGEEQVIENIGISEERTPFAIPLSAFECGSSHTVKVWAVDDAGESSAVETVNINLAHVWGMPEVTAAPTPAQPGTVLFTCTQCGATKTEYIYIGDGNGDGTLNSLDAALILKYDAELITDLTPLQLMLCDASGDGIVNSLDAAAILRYDAGLITEFANANFSLEAYIQLCLEYYGYYGTPDIDPEGPSEDDTTESTPVEDDTTESTLVEDDTTESTPVEDDTTESTPVEDDTTESTPVEDDSSEGSSEEEIVSYDPRILSSWYKTIYNGEELFWVTQYIFYENGLFSLINNNVETGRDVWTADETTITLGSTVMTYEFISDEELCLYYPDGTPEHLKKGTPPTA